MGLIGIDVKRGVRPSEQLVEIERRQQLKPPVIDRAGLGAAGHITQNLIDRIAAEEDALVFERTARATPIAGQRVAANDVAIDLNGFSLIGVPGSHNGISTPSGSSTVQTNVTVRNGVVRNWGGLGINGYYLDNCVLRDLIVETNRTAGLQLGDVGLVRNCIAIRNGGVGIAVDTPGGIGGVGNGPPVYGAAGNADQNF